MALVAVPAAKDTVCFNGHRLYGPFLYQHLFSNWKIIYSEVDKNVESRKVDCTSPKTYSYQPVIIIQKWSLYHIRYKARDNRLNQLLKE